MNCHAHKNHAVHRLNAVKGFAPAYGYEQDKESVESVVSAKRSSCHSGCEVPVIGTEANEYWTQRMKATQTVTLGLVGAVLALVILLVLKK